MSKKQDAPEHEEEQRDESHRHVRLGAGEKLHVHIPDPNPKAPPAPQAFVCAAASEQVKVERSMFRHILTDYDNVTFDTGRVIVVFVAIIILLVTLAMTAVAGFQVYNIPDTRFDFLNFGGGIAALLGGFSTLLGAFAIYINQDTKGKASPTAFSTAIPPPTSYPSPALLPTSTTPPAQPPPALPVKQPVVIPKA